MIEEHRKGLRWHWHGFFYPNEIDREKVRLRLSRRRYKIVEEKDNIGKIRGYNIFVM